MNNPVIENVTDLAEPQVVERSQAYVAKMQILQRREGNAHTQVRAVKRMRKPSAGMTTVF